MGKKKQASNNQKNKTKDEDSTWDEVAQMAARNEQVEQQEKKQKQKSSSVEQSNTTSSSSSNSTTTTGAPFTEQQIRHLVETLTARLKNEEKAELEKIESETVKTISDLKIEVLKKLGLDSQSDKLKTVTSVLDKHFEGVAKQNSEFKRENAILTLRLQTSEIRGVEVDKQLATTREQKEKLQQMCNLLHENNQDILNAYETTKKEHSEKYDALAKKFSDALEDIRVKMEAQSEERIQVEKEKETLHYQLEIYKQQMDLVARQGQNETKKVSLEKQLYEAKLEELLDLLTKKEKENLTLKKKVETANHERNIMSKQLKTSQSKMDEFTKTVQETKNSFVTFQNRINHLEEENKALREKLKKSIGMESQDAKKKNTQTTVQNQ